MILSEDVSEKSSLTVLAVKYLFRIYQCDLEQALLAFQMSECYRTEFGKTLFITKVDYCDLVLLP